jgi:uncharacterized protein (TIGR03435 family)
MNAGATLQIIDNQGVVKMVKAGRRKKLLVSERAGGRGAIRRNYRWTLVVLLLACWAVSPATAQNGAANRFEVASVKPVVPNPNVPLMAGVTVRPGGRVVLSGMPLKGLIGTAFRLSFWQISGGDNWMDKDLYVIEAKAPENSGITNFNYSLYDIDDARLREMLQALLIDRFQLRVHRETKTGDAHQLTRTNKPLGLSPAKIPEGGDPASIRGDIGYAGGRWVIRSFTMPQLAKFASSYVVRASVVDLTNLSGAYDYTQTVPDQDPNYSDNTDSFLRLLRDVGLELKRSRGPVETLVIDSAERPSPN